MIREQIKEFQRAIGTAAWNLNLDRFADAIGASPEHDYTRDGLWLFVWYRLLAD